MKPIINGRVVAPEDTVIEIRARLTLKDWELVATAIAEKTHLASTSLPYAVREFMYGLKDVVRQHREVLSPTEIPETETQS